MHTRSPFPSLLLAACLPAFATFATAAIDSGGGKTSVGPLNNHASLGGTVAAGPIPVASHINRPGLIEVLFPSTSGITNPDADGNGLPDAWEIANFGATGVDPAADADGDTTNNRFEYLAGTDPRDRLSVFRPAGTYSGSLFHMALPTANGRQYKIWISRDLQNWVLDTTLTGNGQLQAYQFDETTMPPGPFHSSIHPSSYFFRIEVVLP